MAIRSLAAVALLLAATPTSATPVLPTPIPEPTDAALFAVGLAGLWLGRRASRRRPPRD